MTFRIREAQSDALAQSNVGNHLAKLLRPTAKESLYDERAHCVRVVGFRGQTTRIDIDSKGNVARVLSPLARATLYSYEGRRPVGIRLASGLSIQTRYDAVGRVTRSERSDGEYQQLGYDGAGNLVSLGTADGATVHLQVDNQARVERVHERDGASTASIATYPDVSSRLPIRSAVSHRLATARAWCRRGSGTPTKASSNMPTMALKSRRLWATPPTACTGATTKAG